jgi:signal transduction histidine kinase
LAATIAHEINNPLAAVVNLHYLMSKAASLEEALRYLAIADQELARVTEITTHTLHFHHEATMPAEVDVRAVMDSVVKLYERRIAAASVVVQRRLSPSAVIMGSAGELRQVFANLISNSLDAMPRGGKLYLRVETCTEHRNPRRRGVRVVVSDTGSGIPLSIREKVLEPFVSTKDDKGTGLGLWVSSEIVRKHHGTIRFKSWPGRGTIFSIFLPFNIVRFASGDVPAFTPGLARTGT